MVEVMGFEPMSKLQAFKSATCVFLVYNSQPTRTKAFANRPIVYFLLTIGLISTKNFVYKITLDLLTNKLSQRISKDSNESL